MAQDWFDQGTTSAPAPRQGRIVRDPYKAREEGRKDEDQDFERRRLAMEAERVRLAQEAARLEAARAAQAIADANRGTIPEGMQLVNGQLQTIPGFVSDRDAQGRVNGLIGQINEVQRLFNSGPATTRGVAGIRDFVPGGDNARFDKAAASLEDIATGAFKVPGMGAQSDADAARLAAAIKPNRWAYDEAIDQQLKDVRRRVDEWLKARGMPSAAWEAPASLEGVLEQAAKADAAGGYTPEFIAQYRSRFGEDPPPIAGANIDGGAGGPPTPPPAGSYGDSYFAQGTSGINTGIGNAVGAPVDILSMGLNLIPRGINALTNSDLPLIQNPVGGADWWNGGLEAVGSIHPETNDPNKQFLRRVGESLGGAAIPIGATARTGQQALLGVGTALAGGLGGATAQQVAPGNLIAEILAETATGAGAGFGAVRAARRAAQRGAESAIPTVRQLKDEASDLYQRAEATGTPATRVETGDLAQRFDAVAQREALKTPTGRMTDVSPRAKEAYQLVGDYAQGDMTPKQMNTVRKVVADAASSKEASERRIGKLLLDEFDDWAAQFAPDFAQARATSRRYINAEELERLRAVAEANSSQFTASGFENALRTQYRTLDRAIESGAERGWSDPLVEAIRKVSRGTTGSNAARAVGRLAPTTPWSFTASAALPATVGTAMFGPVGGLTATAGTTGLGVLGRGMATRMAMRNADEAEMVARNGGALPALDPALTDAQKRVVLSLLTGEGAQYLQD